MSDRLNRRQAIAGAAAVVAAGAGAYALASGDDDQTEPTTVSGSRPDCVLAPEQTEGPYYLDNGLIRRDISEGADGVALELRLQVLAAEECTPVAGATVELWHCDANGVYSGVDGDSGSFCRGGQRTGAGGWTTFRTIYPGWYQGRATHIHVKVHAGGSEVHTGQLYFPDDVNAEVHRAGEPYRTRGEADTTNADDGIYGQGGPESTVRVARRGSGYLGRLALGVRA